MTAETKHTQGPWNSEPQEDGCSVAFSVTDAGGTEIAVTSGRPNSGEEEANARLIAAAPDLLALVRRWVASGNGPYGLLADSRAALAKAGG